MPNVPTVKTFLFTDIESSTRRWEHDPTAMRAAMQQHDRIIDGLVTQYDGVVVRPRGEGDSRFAVFDRAADAVAAACEIQLAFAWPSGEIPTGLRVRVALHTGRAERGEYDGDYYGSDVNRCARLRALAHGGQSLLSQATFEAARGALPADVQLVFLGRHALKDFPDGEQVYQLKHPDLADVFPPLGPPDATYDVRGRPCPYVGLESFTRETSERYAGREQQVRQALRLLTSPGEEQVLLFVTGASGSGKSSFAQAGLIPALEAHYSGLGKRTQFAVFRPGGRPLAALARAIMQLGLPDFTARHELTPTTAGSAALWHFVKQMTPAQQVNLLVLDQFEELFTQAESAEREAFFALFIGLGAFGQVRTHVIATLRADYLSALFEVGEIFQAAKSCSVELRAMTPYELGRAIRRPLEWQNEQLGGDKSWQPELAERLVADMGDQPTLLPLLQVTQEAIWSTGRLTLDRYQTLTNALEARAEAVYERRSGGQAEERPAREQEMLMELLLEMVAVSPDDDPLRDVRRSVSLVQLVQGSPERARLVEELVSARLLSTSLQPLDHRNVDMVDLIHEALLHNWPRLRLAVEAHRELLDRRERFRLAAQDWAQHGKTDPYLLQGVRLAEARELAIQKQAVIGDAGAREFLAQSNARDQRSRRQRERTIVGVGTALAMLAVIAGVLALGLYLQSSEANQQRDLAVAQRDRADAQARLALSRQLAAEALSQTFNSISGRLDLGLLLSNQAYQVQNTPEARASLLTALNSAPASNTLTLLHAPASVTSVALDNRGTLVASGGEDGVVRLWDLSTRQISRSFTGHIDRVNSVSFSPDATLIASASTDKTVRLWDVTTGRLEGLLTGHGGSVTSVAFGPDGKLLVSAGDDKTVRIWDVATRQSLVSLQRQEGPVNVVAFSPDGTLIATASDDMTVQLWDAHTRQAVDSLAGHTDRVTSLAFSPDGSLLASGGYDLTVRLWDLRSRKSNGAAYSPAVIPIDHRVFALAFSPDGTRLAVSSGNVVRQWTLPDLRPLTLVYGLTGFVDSLAFSPNGTTLVGGVGKVLQLWSLTGAQPLAVLNGHTDRVTSVALSRDGSLLASGSADKTVRLWDVASRQPVGILSGSTASVNSVAFSFDGAILASGSEDHTVRLWDTRSHQLLSTLTGLAGFVNSIAFNPDGLLAVKNVRAVELWDALSLEHLAWLTGHSDFVSSVAFSPDGTILASASWDKTVRLWDVHTRRLLVELRGHTDAASSVAFSPDGVTLASGSFDKSIRLWDVHTHQLQASLTRGLPVTNVAFSADGNTLADSEANTVQLWDMGTRQPLGAFVGDVDVVSSLAFSPDDGMVVAAQGKSVRFWDTSLSSWLERTCRIANRNLTLAEWDQFMGATTPYQRTCRDLPPGDDAPVN